MFFIMIWTTSLKNTIIQLLIWLLFIPMLVVLWIMSSMTALKCTFNHS